MYRFLLATGLQPQNFTRITLGGWEGNFNMENKMLMEVKYFLIISIFTKEDLHVL